ncbi:hypothetical protein Tco_1107889 [Tanacetum coccineum]
MLRECLVSNTMVRINFSTDENLISNGYAVEDIGTSSSTGRHLTQEEEAKEALALRISQKFALSEEVRPVPETMAYHDKYKKVGVTTIIAKFLILDIPIDRDAPIVVGRGFLYTIGGIINTPERIFSTFDGIYHQTFRVARSDVLRTGESNSDDEEEYEIKRNKFEEPIYGPKPAAYLNCNNPVDRSLALQAIWEETMTEAFTWNPYALGKFETWERSICSASPSAFLLWGRLGLYHAEELDEDGFCVYFQGGLRSVDHFNAQYAASGSIGSQICDLRTECASHELATMPAACRIVAAMRGCARSAIEEYHEFYPIRQDCFTAGKPIPPCYMLEHSMIQYYQSVPPQLITAQHKHQDDDEVSSVEIKTQLVL